MRQAHYFVFVDKIIWYCRISHESRGLCKNLRSRSGLNLTIINYYFSIKKTKLVLYMAREESNQIDGLIVEVSSGVTREIEKCSQLLDQT
jgi:hypothetical protein